MQERVKLIGFVLEYYTGIENHLVGSPPSTLVEAFIPYLLHCVSTVEFITQCDSTVHVKDAFYFKQYTSSAEDSSDGDSSDGEFRRVTRRSSGIGATSTIGNKTATRRSSGKPCFAMLLVRNYLFEDITLFREYSLVVKISFSNGDNRVFDFVHFITRKLTARNHTATMTKCKQTV